MKIRKAEIGDLGAITEIYNYAIVNLTATFDEQVKALEDRNKWFLSHQEPKYSLLVAEEENEIIGWGSISAFRPRSAYRFTGETSIYVRNDKYGRGIGSLILAELITVAKQEGLHSLIGIIADKNEASIGLHAKQGFEIVGHFKEVGYKFNKWLDVIVMQKLL